MRFSLRLVKIGLFIYMAGLLSCTSKIVVPELIERQPSAAPSDDPYTLLRGNPGEYDPGAPPDSRWIELYGSAPNYRQIGKAILGGTGEKFRWEMGPMWYRGRLGKDQVKVFIVGQEGAQDENVSNRAFTGSTGTKTQKFLNHIGIYRSYLFMNTFVYTINGQLDGDPKFNYLEQGQGVSHPELSPIVRYRHKLFDNMMVANSNSIALFMGVGSGGKASLATWINARGGRCNVANNLQNCDTSGMVEFFRNGFTAPYGDKIQAKIPDGMKILVVGVPHPGGASPANGGQGALDNIIKGFTKAAQNVAALKNADSRWLPQDPDDPKALNERLAEMNAPYQYKDAGIPYRDFAFGTNWRMGQEGTTSNRWGADSIQVFSKNGEYGDKKARYNEREIGKFAYAESNLERAGFKNGVDMPWEPPRWSEADPKMSQAYDAGPCGHYDNHAFYTDQTYAQPPCPAAGYLKLGWPTVANAQSASLGLTSMYRGRIQGAKIVVIADQTSHDDFFSGRALSGEAGQRLQTWLQQQNIGSNYLIVRTSPWDSLTSTSANDPELLKLAEPNLRAFLVEVVKSKPKLIVSLGPWAQQIAQKVATENSIEFKNLELSEIGKLALSPIPREDLPYHSRWWMGTSGNRAVRGDGGTLKGRSDGKHHYYRVYAPKWNSTYAVPKASPEDMNLITQGLTELK